MSNAPKYRKKAVEFEQLKQFDRAVASYVRAIEENENASEDVDVALFNKVGDLTLRQGRVTEAVTYYERAVEHYVSNSLYDNAIALCNKILRNAPGRSNVYFTLGRICGRKGLRTDATRNFLEYATRMQQEGRVDEGMRALAEVADLMPELTEVRRLVEEHAERAGISLAPRRRATPVRSASAVDAEPVRSFGLSKDLVFLQIDYDAVKAAREKTPPPQRSVQADFERVSEMSAVAESKARSETSVPPPLPSSTTRLEDLMIFDPNSNADAPSDDFASADVVDGSSILKPYADFAEPVESLDDIEPTELAGIPAHTDAHGDAIAGSETISDLLQRGVTPRAPGESLRIETPVVVASIPTLPEFPAIPVPDEAPPTDDVESPLGEALLEVSTEPVVECAAARGDESTVESAVKSNVASADESTVASVADSTAYSTVDSTVERIETPLPAEEAAVEPVVNEVVAPEPDFSIPVGPLEGVTANDEPPVADDIIVVDAVGLVEAEPLPVADDLVVIEAAGLVTDEVLEEVVDAVAPDVVQSIDFDAMLDLAEVDVSLVADLETEEFAPANDELASARFVRADQDAPLDLADEFESAAELSPLIFPMPAEDAFADSIEFVAPTNEAFSELLTLDDAPHSSFDIGEMVEFEPLAAFEDIPELSYEAGAVEPIEIVEAVAPSDIVFLDIPDVDAPLLTPIALDILEAPAAVADVSFDLLDEMSLVSADLDDVLLVSDDLDDLFGDTEISTSVVAAEATLVASSRCSELRAASLLEPDNYQLRRRLAEALFEASDRDDAITELSAALAGAEFAGALSDAADMADQLVRVAGAEISHHQKRLELAIRLGDQTRLRDAYLDLADNLVRRGEDLRAKAVYARVLEIDPWDDRARTALGDAAPPPPAKPPAIGSDEGHVSLADWLRDEDEPASTRLRMREPDISGDEQGDFNTLLKHFKEGVARSLGEDDYESHYDLGVAYKEMGLLDDAIGEFQMALRSRSNRLAAYEALGQCFIEQESYKVAVTVLSRALHEPAIQDEQRVGVLYLLGISCEVLQRFDEARGYFQRVYATDIHFRDVGQRLADLERTVR